MELFGLKRKPVRVRSRGQHRSRRSRSPTDHAQNPREAPSASVESGSEDDEEGQHSVRDERGSYEAKPSAEYQRGREQAQPYGSPHITTGWEVVPSPTPVQYASSGSHRPPAQYHSGRGQRHHDVPWEHEAPGAHLLSAESSPKVASLEHGLQGLQIVAGMQPGEAYYTHSPPVPKPSKSLETSSDLVPSHLSTNAYTTTRENVEAGSSSQDSGFTQDAAKVGLLVTPRASSTSQYQPQPGFITRNTPTFHPQNLDATRREDATQYYSTGQPSEPMHNASTYLSQNFESARPQEQMPHLYPVAGHPDAEYVSPAQPLAQPYHPPHNAPDGRSRLIRGTPGRNSETLDPSYQVRNTDYKKFFRVGRVFITLWSDPLGESARNNDPTFLSEVKYGQMVFTKVRRFVIVRVSRDKRSVTCLPVTSYSGAGHTKKGIDLSEHGFIYSKRKPEKVDGLRSKPLKVVLSARAGSLQDPSLIHYGKVYTVETNVKVKDVGKLDAESEKTLLHYFKKVFSDIDTDLQGPGMTPRASEAALMGMGAAMDNFSQPPVPGNFQSSAMPQSDFNLTSAPAGFPPHIPYGASGRFEAPTEPTVTSEHPRYPPYTPPATFPSTANSGYSSTGYDVAVAQGRSFNGPAYTQAPATNSFYSQQPPPAGSLVSEGTTYPDYQPQGQYSWSPTAHQSQEMNPKFTHDSGFGVVSNSGATDDYGPPRQPADNQWEGSPGGSVGGVTGSYSSPPSGDSAAAEGDLDEDIELPSVQSVQQANKRETRSGYPRRRRHGWRS